MGSSEKFILFQSDIRQYDVLNNMQKITDGYPNQFPVMSDQNDNLMLSMTREYTKEPESEDGISIEDQSFVFKKKPSISSADADELQMDAVLKEING